MKASKRNGLMALLLLLATAAGAQESRRLTLQEAVDLSLQNSKQIRLNQARIQEATAAYREARDNRLPDLTVSGSYLRVNQPTVDLKVRLGSGGTDTGGSSAAPVTVNQVAYLMANASLPLFAGFKIQAGIESAKYLALAAQLDAAANQEEVMLNTIAAYSNLYKAEAAVGLVHENLRQSQQRVKDLSNLEKNGLLARNDLLKAQLAQSNIELALLDAQSNLSTATVNMNLMLGLPEETRLATDSTAFTAATSDERTLSAWEASAITGREDLQAIGYRVQAANAGVKAAKGDYYPSLALTSGYVAMNIPDFLTVTNAVNVGVGVRYAPSALWKNGAKVASAKARLQQVSLNQDLLTDQVRIQINQAYQAYVLSRKKIEVFAAAVEQAAENYRIVRNKQENALATTTDLLEADVAQLQARLNYANAKADAVVAYNRLLRTAGSLSVHPEVNIK